MNIYLMLQKRCERFMWLGLICTLAALAGCPSSQTSAPMAQSPAATTGTPGMSGSVYGGRQPIAGATVIAYEIATTNDGVPTEIGNTTTDSNGNFTLSFSPTPVTGQPVYLVAIGGNANGSGTNSAIALMTIAGGYCTGPSCNFPASVNIDELTTVAVTALAARIDIEFVACSTITGNTQPPASTCVSIPGTSDITLLTPALSNPVADLVDVTSGQASSFLTAQASGSAINTTLEKLDTLADVLANCVNSSGPTSSQCTGLFNVAFAAPDTLQAAYRIAAYPGAIIKGQTIFNLLGGTTVYTPVLTTAPNDWLIAGERYAYVLNDGSAGAPGAVTWYLMSHDLGVMVSNYGISSESVGTGSGSNQVILTPNGRFAYVLNASSVSAYTVDPASGALTTIIAGSCGVTPDPDDCYSAGNGPEYGTVDPSSQYLFVTNQVGNNVSVWQINADTGALTPVTTGAVSCGPSPEPSNCFPAGANPLGITAVAESAGTYIYVANASGDDVSVYSLGSGGALSNVAGSACGGSPSPNPNNCFAAGDQPEAVAVNATGAYLYAVNHSGNDISAYTIDAASGVLSDVAGSSCGIGPSNCFPAGSLPSNASVTASGLLYVSNASGNDVSAYTIGTGGALTAVPGSACGGSPSPNPNNCFAAGTGPQALESDLGGSDLYVLNVGATPTVSAYKITRSGGNTGALTALSVSSTLLTATMPQQATIDPTGRFLYTTSSVNPSVGAYSIDPESGAISQVNGSPFATNGAGSDYDVTVDPTGQFAYVAEQGAVGTSSTNGDVAAFTINSDGSLTTVSGSPFSDTNGAVAVTVSPNGKFLYDSDIFNVVTTWAIGSGGGLATIAGSPFAAGNEPVWGVTDPLGQYLYVSNYTGSDVSAYTLNASTGTPTPVTAGVCGVTPEPGNCFPTTQADPYGEAIDSSGKFLYVADYASTGVGGLSGFQIGSGGALTALAGLPNTGSGPFSVVVDSADRFVYVSDCNDGAVYAYGLNTSTGALTTIGSPLIVNGATDCIISLLEDPTARFVYAVDQTKTEAALFDITQSGSSAGTLTVPNLSSPYPVNSADKWIVLTPVL